MSTNTTTSPVRTGTPTNIDSMAKGRISELRDDGRLLVFKPTGTNYELHFRTLDSSAYTGPVGSPVQATLRLVARKVYTVPSGGNFVSPIFGPPKIVQGRVIFADDRQLVVHAGANFVVELPSGDSAIDLNNGAITVGAMVNVVARPGAMIEVGR